MSRDPVAANSSLAGVVQTLRRPWPILWVGLGCTVAGLALSYTSLVPLRLLFLGAGILLAGIAVARRLQTASWDLLEERMESAVFLWAAFVLALLEWFNMEPTWDSGSIFLGAIMLVSLTASFIVLLPRTGRRIAAVVLVALHFGGILTAVSSVAPRENAPPWLAMQLWNSFYRYYLFFGYFTNAYHFYSPDPGPATLLWFHVEYADGSKKWIKIPNRHESSIGLHHQRMLAAAESTMMPGGFLETQEIIKGWEEKYKQPYELLPGVPHPSGEEIKSRRMKATQYENVPFKDPNDIDPKTGQPRPAPLLLLDELPPVQYNEPNEWARRILSSYARHIAHTATDSRDPGNAVVSVRIYRVVHNMISPRELLEGKHPLDDWNFSPFYMGKYDPDGKLLDPDDPFLFWHVPIVRVPQRYPEPGTYLTPPEGGIYLNTHFQPTVVDPGKVINFVEIHATQSDLIRKGTRKK